MSASASPLTCSRTPPGTSHVYGQTMPILMTPSPALLAGPVVTGQLTVPEHLRNGPGLPLRVEISDEDLLQHQPVVRVLPDPLLEKTCELLHHRRDLLGTGAGGGLLYLGANLHPTPAIIGEPQHDRHEGSVRFHCKSRGPGHHLGPLAKELHLDAATGDIPIAGQGHEFPCPQSLCQYPERACAPARR